MPLSALDPVPALILVDLQKGVLRAERPEMLAVIRNAAALAEAFRMRGLPVVLVNVAGGAPGRTDARATRPHTRRLRPENWTEIVPELGTDPEDILITKRRWGAFHDTALDGALRSRGVTQVLIGGVATSIGVESTARCAHEHGYHVVLPIDVMFDGNPDSHTHSITHIFPRLGETTTADHVLRELSRRDAA
ncbi:isochorismatase family protein [Streptomyces sp. 900105755]